MTGVQQKGALITGITGQDGSYLAEFLLSQGYRVIGMVRRASTENFERIAHLRGKIEAATGWGAEIPLRQTLEDALTYARGAVSDTVANL